MADPDETAIQIISDLHLESPGTYVFDIPRRAPYLALLGDIGNVCDPGYLDFLRAQLRKFRCVLNVLGNHEPYGSDWGTTIATLRRFEQENRERRAKDRDSGLGEYILLHRGEYRVPDTDITILGCTLHTNIPDYAMPWLSLSLNDFHKIKHWDALDHNEAHRQDLAWVNTRVREISSQEPARKIIILSHHCPTFDNRTRRAGAEKSALATGYATSIRYQECWENQSVKLWAFGHTHFNCDFVDKRTGKRVYTNQRGYYFGPAHGFDVENVLKISEI